MKKIEQNQIKKIYAIANALGIAESGAREDELHILVYGMTGKESIREMSYAEAGEVITRLQGLQGKAASPKTSKKKAKEKTEKPGGVTKGQQKKIWFLMYRLKEQDETANDVPLGKRLCKIIKKELGMDAEAKEPFIWMDFAQGTRLIEILKKYVESAEKKRGARDGAGVKTG